ncbi:MAG: hypothetical protein EA360_01525 [Balneolaceae bacterium]|nr:MAG: hypothetical protein EA360_01525 [Balneolaceae bacterium]
MSEFERQHPIAAISRAAGLIRGNLITILVFLFVGAQSDNFPFLWWIGGGFGFLLATGIVNWWRFLYKLEDDTLHIRSGIFVRKDLYLTRDRVQVIDISSGVLQRLFGLVRLDIQTAGSSSRQAAIDAITVEKAEEINQNLRKQRISDTGEHTEEEAGTDRSSAPPLIIAMPFKELIIAASTSGSFGIALSILGTLFSQAEPFISDSGFFDFIFGLLPSESDTLMIASVILLFVLFAWLLSFFGTLFTYGNFSLELRKDEIIISRGIFEKKRVTIPFNRIQAVHVTEGLIRQPLGYASIHLESAGYGDEKGTGSIVLFPLIHKKSIQHFFRDVLPHCNTEAAGIKPPPRALRRYLFRSTLPALLLAGALYQFLQFNLLVWILPILALIWGWLKFRDTALGFQDDLYIIRSRRFSRSTAYIRRKRIQDATLSESPFQRFRALCSFELHVASGDQGKTFSVRDIEQLHGLGHLSQLKKEHTIHDTQAEEIRTDQIRLPGWMNPNLSKTIES